MTTEELKIIISAEAEDAIRDLNTVKKGVNDLGNTSGTDKLKGSFSGNSKAVSELKTQLSEIKALNMASAFSLMTKALDGARDRAKTALSGFKLFGEELRGMFNFENFDVSNFGELFDSMKIQGQEAAASLKAAFANLGKSINAVATSSALALAKIVVVLVAIVGTIRTAISAANRLTASFYEAQKIGMNHATYQEWAYVMGQVGVEADKLSDFLKTLAAEQNELRDGTEDVVKSFEALGLSAEEAAGMSQEELFGETVKRLQQIENQVERTSLAYRIFGEDDAAELTNILNLNNQEMERMISNFYLLGGSASDGAIQKSRIFTGAVSNMKLAWQGLSNTLGEAILPVLTTVVNAITKAIVAVNLFIRTVFGFDLIAKGTKNTIEGTSVNLGTYTDSVKGATTAVEKLKRTTQGFDELNIVSNPTTGGGAGAGGGGGADSYEIPSVDIPQIDMEGLTQDLGLEEMTKWFEENAEEIKKWTTVVLAATGAWEAFRIGYFLFTGEKLGFFTGIGVILSKVVGWLGAVIGLLKEGNSFWAVMGAAFPGIAKGLSAVGAAFSKVWAAIGGAVKAVGSFIGGLSGGTIAIIIAVIVLLASAIYFCVQNWDKLVQATKNWFAENIVPKFEKIKEVVSQLGGVFQELWGTLVVLGATLWDIIPDGVKEFLVSAGIWVRDIVVAIGEWFASINWLEAIGTIFEWLGGIVTGILGGVIGGAIRGLIGAITGLVEFVVGIVQVIVGIVQALGGLVIGIISGDFTKVYDAIKTIWDGIVNIFKGAYDATIGVVVDFVKGIINWFTELWDVLVGHSIVPDMINAIIDWFKQLPGKLFKMVGDFVRGIIDFFKDLAKQAGQWAGTMWTNIKKPFESVGSWFKDIFTKALNGIKGIFKGIGDWFKTNVVTPITNVFSDIGSKIGNAVKTTFSKAINTVLETAVGIINGFIGAINLAIDVLNAVPGVSITKLTKLDVPKLATGGIVTGETLARIGEGGKREAVLPLDQNTGWMDMLADRIASRNNAPTKIVLMVNERELGWASINGINGITKQTGGIQLQLV